MCLLRIKHLPSLCHINRVKELERLSLGSSPRSANEYLRDRVKIASLSESSFPCLYISGDTACYKGLL